VPDLTTAERHARDETVIADLRAHEGKTSSGQALIILEVTGARTGRVQHKPVCVREDGPDLVVAASAGGQPRHPQWYTNLVASPEINVEYLDETFRVKAETVANGHYRDRLFAMMSEEITGLYGYQDRCRDTRQIPVVLLTRL
jgi:deazaflavin-dependent oxidoreductase (nitroreductase family)